MKKLTSTPAEYAESIRLLLEAGVNNDELNAANHLALEQGYITLQHFLAGARVLVDDKLNSIG